MVLLVSAAVFAGLISRRRAGWLEGLELGAYDQFLAVQALSHEEDAPIVLIRIYESDIQEFGYPLCDALLNRALERLLAADARAIGVDIYRDIPVPACGNLENRFDSLNA